MPTGLVEKGLDLQTRCLRFGLKSRASGPQILGSCCSIGIGISMLVPLGI